MTTFWAIARNETRQLWRRRSFWVIQVVLLIPALLSFFGLPLTGTLELFYLLVPLLTGPALLRDNGKVGEMLWSSPADALCHYAGVLAGLWVGLLPGSLLQVMAWFLADLFFPNSFGLWIWPLSLAFLLLANALGVFLTALLAMLARRMVPLMLTWMVAWLWLFLDVIFSQGLSEGFNPMQGKVFNNIFFLNLPLSPSLGLGLSSGRVLGMAGWFFGLGCLAAALGLAVSTYADRRRAVRRPLFVPALVIAGALLAAGGYALNARAAAASAMPPSPYDPQIDTWKVESQVTEVEVDASTGVISGASRLTLAPISPVGKPEVVLRLNPGLALAYARDGSGSPFPARRDGDSVVISLPAVPSGPFPIELAWRGRLQIPYLSYEQSWRFPDGPGDTPYMYMPAPLKQLLAPQGGFLLRDGDWMPWPWSTAPHQAGQNSLTIRPTGGEAVAAQPIQDGAAVWNGALPQGLVSFLPAKKTPLGTASLSVSPLAGSQHTARAGSFAAAAGQLAGVLGEQPPRNVVVTPYLSDLVWNDGLLLIPDWSGFNHSLELYWLYQQDAGGPKQELVRRTALFLLTRHWLHQRYPPSRMPFQPLLSPRQGPSEVVSLADVSEARWTAEDGHWLQFAESMDLAVDWSGRRKVAPTPAGEQSAMAFWLAMELADEQTRQADLDLLEYFAGVGQELAGWGDRYRMMQKLGWPSIMEARQARELIGNLHEWAVQVGPEEAVRIGIEAIRQAPTWDQGRILEEMIARSGVPIGEVAP